MTQTIDTAKDVVTFLKAQHEQIKGAFARVEASHGAERTEAFDHLRRLLAVHETAEEEIVHPSAKSEISGGDKIVSARLAEENEAKQALAALENVEVDSAEFDSKFAELRTSVISHAEAEESEEFSKLAGQLDDAQLARMRKAAELAERTAPTHPHPGTESQAANLAVGPFASMLDRAKDLINN